MGLLSYERRFSIWYAVSQGIVCLNSYTQSLSHEMFCESMFVFQFLPLQSEIWAVCILSWGLGKN